MLGGNAAWSRDNSPTWMPSLVGCPDRGVGAPLLSADVDSSVASTPGSATAAAEPLVVEGPAASGSSAAVSLLNSFWA